MARQCIFCHRKADSKEHIWSKWILDLLPDKPGRFTQRLHDGTERTWSATKPELSVGFVCERNCNNGWMNAKLEGPMRAATRDIIIHPAKKAFTDDECSAISAWSFKTAILASYMTKAPEFFSLEQRYAFSRDLTIPQGVFVWIARRDIRHLQARFPTSYDTKQAQREVMPHLIRLPVHPYSFDTYTCVLSIGYLLLQVVAAKWTDRKIAKTLDFPSILSSELFDSYTTPIWPPPRLYAANWPPSRSIGNNIFDTFCDRFKEFTLPEWMG
jgi:hypothetical protein